MDYRRCFGLRAPRPVGDSTILVPQLENYSLFSTPFLDLNKKNLKFLKEMQEDVKKQPEENVSVKKTTKRGGDKSKGKKAEEDDKKPSEEDKLYKVNFGIVLNVVTVEPDQLTITFGEGNEIEVKVQQTNVKSLYGSISFSRNCSYKYQLPDDVDKKTLVALRTSDDYLIILTRDQLREDLLKKSITGAEEITEEAISHEEATGSTDIDEKGESIPGSSKSKKVQPKKPPSRSKEAKEKTKPKKVSDKDASDSVGEGAELVFLDDNCLIPIQVTRMLKPGMDIFLLRKYVADLESYVSTVRKFIENASFVSQNSKTAERCIRFLAKKQTEKFYKIKGFEDKSAKFTGDSSPEAAHPSVSATDSDESPKSSGAKTEKAQREIE